MKVNGESFDGSFKRRKQEDQTQSKLEKNNNALFYQRSKSESARLIIKPDVQHNLDTKVQSETFEDHRPYLDLDLNLSSSSSSSVNIVKKKDECSKEENMIMTSSKKGKSGDIGLKRSPSWLAFEGDDDDDDQKKQEMVTTVCMKCHMLVMLCKSALVCPNCKFMHPDDESFTKQFKPLGLFKLLC
ncbi:unnamed protein product [Microthlaspi erraticum]|uniref:Uncharacterized protein n=1 Tax=Microthlaspi erraticum TaxID=1685480 RepID=A0A6D2K712_9BRAS|nr:unnamed protein product [Microthlaspi erraticum]